MNQNNAAVVLHDTGKRKAAAGRAARFLLMFVLAFGAQAAMAAGGFSEATGPLEKVRDTIYTIVGIVATIALPDHAALDRTALPAADYIFVTEKDAAKLPPPPHAPSNIWVLPIDAQITPDLADWVLAELGIQAA